MSDPRTRDRRTIGAGEAVPEATVADLGPQGRPDTLGGTLSGEIDPGKATGGVTHALEIGPGKVLANLVKRIAKDIKVLSVGEAASLDQVAGFLH